MVKKLDGKKLAQEIELRLKNEINIGLEIVKRKPGLAVIRVGDDPASGVYVSNKEKACKRVGIESFVLHLPTQTTYEEVNIKIKELNLDQKIDGVLLQLPLPLHLNETSLINRISPDKDADGLHALNLGLLVKGEKGPRSCTPSGVMALLKANNISIEGKRAVVIGRSILVGRPMALMLEAANATVSIAHSKTKNLRSLTKEAELLVVAAGKPQLIGLEDVREDSVVIDVGIHRILSEEHNNFEESQEKENRLCGDVNTKAVESKVAAITPVPGGVGPMTVSMLLVNTVRSWQKHCGLPLTIGDLLP